MSEFLEYSLLGILSGGVTALVALSFVLIYKGTGVVNFAVGEVMMLGAYLYYAGAVTFELAPWLAFVIALAALAALAVVVERLVLRPLSGQAAVAVLMATIGMASIIHGVVEAVAAGYLGGKTRDVVPYVVVLAILVVRPHGMFGTRTIERL